MTHPPLHIQILSGPDVGKRLMVDQSPVTFGRESDNTVVLDLPTTSRRHGELRVEGGQWLLINHSPNGTRLNGKAVRKPRVLPQRAEIAIGDDLVMHIQVQASLAGPGREGGAGGGEGSSVSAATPPPERRLSGRHKIWIGIGAYLLLMVGLFIFFSTLDRSDESQADAAVPELSGEVIRAEIRTPLPKQPPDARRAREAILEAQEMFALVDVEVDALYRAHVSYQRALAYTRGDMLDDPVDQRRMGVIQQRLATEVVQRYQRAYNMLRSRQYDTAAQGFRDLLAFYPNPQSEVFRNAQLQWDAARRAADRRR